jgi:hypothetical protein
MASFKARALYGTCPLPDRSLGPGANPSAQLSGSRHVYSAEVFGLLGEPNLHNPDLW